MYNIDSYKAFGMLFHFNFIVNQHKRLSPEIFYVLT